MNSQTGSDAATNASQEFLSGKLSQVDVGRIERELRQMWKKASQDGSASTVMRACSFNIIVFSNDDNAESNCGDLLDELLTRRPGRGILAAYRPDKTHSLDAYVSARCHLEGKNKQICAESITVCLEGGQPDEMASVVLPLLLTELPVFLYWRANLDNNWQDVLEALLPGATRLVVDSQRQPFSLAQFQRMQKVMENKHSFLVVSDLNWRRMSCWLRAIADAFDGFPLPCDYLRKFRKLNIWVGESSSTGCPSGADTGPSTQALLLTGWLANRLGWLVSTPLHADCIKYERADGAILDVEFKFTDVVSRCHGYVVKLECVFDGDRTLEFNAERAGDISCIVAHLHDGQDRETTRAHYDLPESQLLGQEIDTLTSDLVYEGAVEAAAAALA